MRSVVPSWEVIRTLSTQSFNAFQTLRFWNLCSLDYSVLRSRGWPMRSLTPFRGCRRYASKIKMSRSSLSGQQPLQMALGRHLEVQEMSEDMYDFLSNFVAWHQKQTGAITTIERTTEGVCVKSVQRRRLQFNSTHEELLAIARSAALLHHDLEPRHTLVRRIPSNDCISKPRH
ncbi:uncharacterized protein M421DRAFT_394949 [Didymella exigua CBS 183.55]|uniref:Uncharacterized protein n=1 Tax=Didymella exigua CBS 183.55 TaxID=1150837 RepID=A0A6A5RJ99_9PLEO|nr:uncharacterized protein M421DRAFT_394949 [Didymella exigua CBS 183.55]KAF1927044.1 hypothetical protein M421DRAFT_394949 [Didymella exigua CBS 183.55]